MGDAVYVIFAISPEGFGGSVSGLRASPSGSILRLQLGYASLPLSPPEPELHRSIMARSTNTLDSSGRDIRGSNIRRFHSGMVTCVNESPTDASAGGRFRVKVPDRPSRKGSKNRG